MNTFKHYKQTTQESGLNYGIILSVLLLALIGILSMYATTVLIEGQNLVPTLFHALWYGVGAILVIILVQIDSNQYYKMAYLLYGLGIVLLILVLFFYDRELAAYAGAHSWFRIGSLTFQPSEVFKPAYIILMARIITEHNHQYFNNRTLRTDWLLLGKIALVTLPPVILIQLQNDLGTNLVVLIITAAMIFMSGISWRIILPVVITVTVVSGGILYLAIDHPEILGRFVHDYQIARIHTWLDPFSDTQNDAYQLVQSIKAIGSGEMFGKGFGVSEVVVPVRESDFIFTTIAENFGFIGAGALLLIYFVLIYQMIQTCFETQNEFYTYITTGVVAMILFHIVENVGMNIGLLPITGIPLPFISQGGSALLGNMIGVGLVLSMTYHHRDYQFSRPQHF